ncbi:hypothetical protein [Amycolatopsis sp. Hca4]|nr:hypothetical protein [Amycolatopsis sp. Hca4]
MAQPRSAILAGLQDMLPTMSTAGSVAGDRRIRLSLFHGRHELG